MTGKGMANGSLNGYNEEVESSNNNDKGNNNDNDDKKESVLLTSPQVVIELECDVIDLGDKLANQNKHELCHIWKDFYRKQYPKKIIITFYDSKHLSYYVVQSYMDEKLQSQTVRHIATNDKEIDVWNRKDINQIVRQILKIVEQEERSHRPSPLKSMSLCILQHRCGIMMEIVSVTVKVKVTPKAKVKILVEQSEIDNNEFEDFHIDYHDLSRFIFEKQNDVIESIGKYIDLAGKISLPYVEQVLNQDLQFYAKNIFKTLISLTITKQLIIVPLSYSICSGDSFLSTSFRLTRLQCKSNKSRQKNIMSIIYIRF
ncbi:hypothetical protein RFI_38768 [Reticulomyxa filosa]|uniref:Uncharacterized protein n=1 Tax=Reticulomyxa filosa TaxID=46433 RepID=X6LC61_RETFI|nr:hypothetical protein RFI_38768 [Reticulomyxa filosa]|eukprot:ETN98726.1 hypothetical protein RFI_38768 [Reticulomyxa filosa]